MISPLVCMTLNQKKAIWQAKASTRYLLADGQLWLEQRLAKQFGSYWVAYQPVTQLSAAGVKQAIWLNAGANTSVICEESAWPLQPNSVDSVVLQHSLEFACNPHWLLRTAVEVLRPGGHLLIVGINPYSFWGMQYQLLTRSLESSAWSLSRLKDALQLLDMSVEQQIWSCFRPVSKHAKVQRYLTVNKVFKPATSVSVCAGIYGIEARKLMAGGLSEVQRKRRFIRPVLPVPISASQIEKK